MRKLAGHNRFQKGVYILLNPSKYLGAKKSPIYRSSWEKTFMHYLDTSDDVEKWCSECVEVPYFFNGEYHRYYPDFFIIMKDKRKIVVEVKPLKQTKPPKKSKNKDKQTIIYEQVTYQKNLAKWNAAKTFCDKRSFLFVIITEKTLRL